MIRGKGLILAMAVAFASACASTGGGGTATPEEAGNRPQDNTYTNAAGVHLAEAWGAESEDAQMHYQAAMDAIMEGLQVDSMNPKLYMQGGQAAEGLEDWALADSMFTKALELYPGYADRIESEREEAWATAYNIAAEALQNGDAEKAISYFEGANTIYKGRPEAMLALGSVYNQQGDASKAADAYAEALGVLNGPPPAELPEEEAQGWVQDRRVAAFNAAQLMAQTGRFADAADVLKSFLSANKDNLDEGTELQATTALAGFLAQSGQNEEASELYNEIFSRPNLTSADYFQVGVGFFNTGDFARAAEAFGHAAELNPYFHDASLNLVQSLYSQALELEKEDQSPERDQQLMEVYEQLVDAARHVQTLDPLNRNLVSFMLRSLRAEADLAGEGQAEELIRETQELYRAYQNQPYGVTNVSVSITDNNRAQISGQLTNLAGTAGDEVDLRLSLVDGDGNVVAEDTVSVTVPEQGSAVAFGTVLDAQPGTFAGWKYEVVN